MVDDIENSQYVQMQKLEALGQFAGGIAHDFNNILSIIEGHMHIAIKQLEKSSLEPEQLQKILKATQRGAGLTRQLLSFGRQKIGVEEKVNLVEALHQQYTLLRPLLGESIKLSMTVPEDVVWINALPDHLTQMVLNLALNARDAMPQGGEIVIRCALSQNPPDDLKEKYPETSFICISVIDNGDGISEDKLLRIFEPFFTTKDQGKGTGLGLSVVYGIVDQLKGSIEVSSVEGEGTVFDIYLPLAASPDVDVIVFNNIKVRCNLVGKTILIAEDEPELRDILAGMFESMRMKVLSAENGNQALLMQDEYDGKIDFLLTDVVMPEMDGVKLGAMFKSIRPDSNVVYMSGYPFMDGRKDIQVPEGELLMRKPFHEDGIRKVLERVLERRKERLKG